MNTNNHKSVTGGKSIMKFLLLAGMAIAFLAGCGGGDDEGGGNQIVGPQPDLTDKTPPTITVHHSSIDITGVEKILISGSELHVGNTLVASWKDNVTKNCKVQLTFDGTTISSGNVPVKSGTLTLTVTDDAGNSKSATVSLKMEEVFPDLTVVQPEVNVFGGATLGITDTQLLIGGALVASWSDKRTKQCKVGVTVNGSEVKNGDTVGKPGKLVLTVTNDQGKSTTAEITLKNEAFSGEVTLGDMHIDEEVNLLSGITLANDATLLKTEIEIDGLRTEIADPQHFTPDTPGTCTIIFTVVGKNGDTAEVRVENITIKPLEYDAMEITNIRPVDILPIIGQVESGDKKVYEHIEHLRLAEATRIRDMMWQYGAGNHSPEEYKQLMNRLNTGMMGENPKGYDNYEAIGNIWDTPSYHAQNERNILNRLINHANFKVIDCGDLGYEILYDEINNKENINIFGESVSREGTKNGYFNTEGTDDKRKLLKLKNFILFGAGTNIKTGDDGILKNKIYQEDIDTNDEHGVYGSPSTANGKNDNYIDKHLLVTIATDADGDIDQTNEITQSSKFPVGFHNKVLFAGRAFPFLSGANNKITGEGGKYATSYTNYVNVAIADLCFQMKADVADVDELLEMIRSTALTDYIRFDLNGDGDTNDDVNGQPESQPLILMNPAGFFKKYLMPTDLPATVSWSNTVALNSGYYHGIVFDIPGAEVNINGQWTAYEAKNKDLILAQNPLTLQWRLNGSLLRKYGYKQGDTVKGQLIVVDDQWHGLNITKDVSIQLTQ